MPLLPSRRLYFKQSIPVVRRRLASKQPAPPWAPAALQLGFLAGLSAIEHESAAADGLLELPVGGWRKHVHYTHVRTHGASDVQPHQLSRREFWLHLVRCYREVYPQEAPKQAPS